MQVLEKKNEGTREGAVEAFQGAGETAKRFHAQPKRGKVGEEEGKMSLEKGKVLPWFSQQESDHVHRIVDALKTITKKEQNNYTKNAYVHIINHQSTRQYTLR
jgi:hypothetical protein